MTDGRHQNRACAGQPLLLCMGIELIVPKEVRSLEPLRVSDRSLHNRRLDPDSSYAHVLGTKGIGYLSVRLDTPASPDFAWKLHVWMAHSVMSRKSIRPTKSFLFRAKVAPHLVLARIMNSIFMPG